jgi:hypothetical protein
MKLSPEIPWIERVPMISIHPEAAARRDVAQLASELMECRKLLGQAWNHMHGVNTDGSLRKYGDDKEILANWEKLSDAIGEYLEP